MKSASLRRLAVLAAVVALAVPVAAQANEVTNWNSIAQNTILAQPPNASAPPASAVFMAMVQGSVYGAVNAIDRRHRPIWSTEGSRTRRRTPPSPWPPSAFSTRSSRRSMTRCRRSTTPRSPGFPTGGPRTRGSRSADAAEAMLAQGHDGRAGPFPPLPPVGPGYWQPLIGPNGNPLLDPSPWVALAQPFLIRSASQFRTAGPNPLTSAAYAADVNEVETLGALDSPFRTPEETHTAVFWQTNPLAVFNGVARRLADERGLDVTDSALLFGMMDLAAGDAQINCWNDKYYWGSWRPIQRSGTPTRTGIRLLPPIRPGSRSSCRRSTRRSPAPGRR